MVATAEARYPDGWCVRSDAGNVSFQNCTEWRFPKSQPITGRGGDREYASVVSTPVDTVAEGRRFWPEKPRFYDFSKARTTILTELELACELLLFKSITSRSQLVLFCSRKGAFMQNLSSKKMCQETQISHPTYTPHTTEEYLLGQIVLFLVVLVAVILQALG